MKYTLPDIPMLHMTSQGQEITDGDTIHIVAIRYELDVQNEPTGEKYVEDYKVTAKSNGDTLEFIYDGATSYTEDEHNELSSKYEEQGLIYVYTIQPASYLWHNIVENTENDLYSIEINKI